MRPFRWNIHKREQLGRLVEGPPPRQYRGFYGHLRECGARVLYAAADSRLVFIGRSPENLFDYLSGCCAVTAWHGRLDLLNLSLRGRDGVSDAPDPAAARTALYEHLGAYHLTPLEIAVSEYPIAFVDLVDSGSTFAALVRLLTNWAREERTDVAAVRRRVRFVGITWRQRTSPNVPRWHQGHAGWLNTFPRIPVKNVSIPGKLWDHWGNRQTKVEPSHPPHRWADPTSEDPPRFEGNLTALRLTVHLYQLGERKPERHALARALARTPGMRESWCRTLVGQLRRGTI